MFECVFYGLPDYKAMKSEGWEAIIQLFHLLSFYAKTEKPKRQINQICLTKGFRQWIQFIGAEFVVVVYYFCNAIVKIRQPILT